jgi:SAM-dependent methyltransferase
MDKPWSSQTSDARNWSQWRRANYDFYKHHLGGLSADKTLVDVGAGPLQFRDIFKRFKYIGVDFVEYPDVTVVADLTKEIPLANASADIVVLSNTLEHIPDPRVTLRECMRILKPGGTIIGTVPFLVQMHQIPYDFNRYTIYQLQALLADSGFGSIEVVPLGKLIDAYATLGLKMLAHMPNRWLRLPFRIVRYVEIKGLRLFFGHLPATDKFTEGYGFVGIKRG